MAALLASSSSSSVAMSALAVDDVRLAVFAHLEVAELALCRSVCHGWRASVDALVLRHPDTGVVLGCVACSLQQPQLQQQSPRGGGARSSAAASWCPHSWTVVQPVVHGVLRRTHSFRSIARSRAYRAFLRATLLRDPFHAMAVAQPANRMGGGRVVRPLAIANANGNGAANGNGNGNGNAANPMAAAGAGAGGAAALAAAAAAAAAEGAGRVDLSQPQRAPRPAPSAAADRPLPTATLLVRLPVLRALYTARQVVVRERLRAYEQLRELGWLSASALLLSAVRSLQPTLFYLPVDWSFRPAREHVRYRDKRMRAVHHAATAAAAAASAAAAAAGAAGTAGAFVAPKPAPGLLARSLAALATAASGAVSAPVAAATAATAGAAAAAARVVPAPLAAVWSSAVAPGLRTVGRTLVAHRVLLAYGCVAAVCWVHWGDAAQRARLARFRSHKRDLQQRASERERAWAAERADARAQDVRAAAAAARAQSPPPPLLSSDTTVVGAVADNDVASPLLERKNAAASTAADELEAAAAALTAARNAVVNTRQSVLSSLAAALGTLRARVVNPTAAWLRAKVGLGGRAAEWTAGTGGDDDERACEPDDDEHERLLLLSPDDAALIPTRAVAASGGGGDAAHGQRNGHTNNHNNHSAVRAVLRRQKRERRAAQQRDADLLRTLRNWFVAQSLTARGLVSLGHLQPQQPPAPGTDRGADFRRRRSLFAAWVVLLRNGFASVRALLVWLWRQQRALGWSLLNDTLEAVRSELHHRYLNLGLIMTLALCWGWLVRYFFLFDGVRLVLRGLLLAWPALARVRLLVAQPALALSLLAAVRHVVLGGLMVLNRSHWPALATYVLDAVALPAYDRLCRACAHVFFFGFGFGFGVGVGGRTWPTAEPALSVRRLDLYNRLRLVNPFDVHAPNKHHHSSSSSSRSRAAVPRRLADYLAAHAATQDRRDHQLAHALARPYFDDDDGGTTVTALTAAWHVLQSWLRLLSAPLPSLFGGSTGGSTGGGTGGVRGERASRAIAKTAASASSSVADAAGSVTTTTTPATAPSPNLPSQSAAAPVRAATTSLLRPKKHNQRGAPYVPSRADRWQVLRTGIHRLCPPTTDAQRLLALSVVLCHAYYTDRSRVFKRSTLWAAATANAGTSSNNSHSNGNGNGRAGNGNDGNGGAAAAAAAAAAPNTSTRLWWVLRVWHRVHSFVTGLYFLRLALRDGWWRAAAAHVAFNVCAHMAVRVYLTTIAPRI